MTIPTITMRSLIEAGVHYGHHTRRWNPKMAPFIFGRRDGIHIIDLGQTVPMLENALKAVNQVAKDGGKILFVGTKNQASEIVANAATKCGQYYVNHRWLGGMLTNWKTVSTSIKRLKEIDALLSSEEVNALTKKEKLNLSREREKLFASLGGIQNMNTRPQLIFVIDTVKEDLAIAEAKKLGIPVVAICDTNSNPDGIDYVVPGNDDAIKAINLYCDLMVETILDGMKAELASEGVDLGESVEAPAETVVEEKVEEVAEEVVEEKVEEQPEQTTTEEEK